jgi:DNA-directed RNA polymerase specialized sigma24 family protein
VSRFWFFLRDYFKCVIAFDPGELFCTTAQAMPDEDNIKKLLASGTASDLAAGMEQLDEGYRMLIWGRLRYWSNQHAYGLTAEDIQDLWQETVTDVWWNVIRGRFKAQGSLEAYLGKIAHCRATDLLRRRRIKIDGNVDLAGIAARAGKSVDELLEEVRQGIGKLQDKLRLVVQVDVTLLFRSGGYWASSQELTAEVNVQGEELVNESTVASRRKRGWKKLWKFLENRGYGS